MMTDSDFELDDYLAQFAPEPGGHRRPPEGYEPHMSAGGFTRHNGPFYRRLDGAVAYRGFYVLSRHCNSMGIANGGLLSAFADSLLALAVYRNVRLAPVTVRLVCDFVASARQEEWVEGRAEVNHSDDTGIFANAELRSGGRVVLLAQGVFRGQQRSMDGTA